MRCSPTRTTELPRYTVLREYPNTIRRQRGPNCMDALAVIRRAPVPGRVYTQHHWKRGGGVSSIVATHLHRSRCEHALSES